MYGSKTEETQSEKIIPDLDSAGVLPIRKSVFRPKETLKGKEQCNILHTTTTTTQDTSVFTSFMLQTYLTDARGQADGVLTAFKTKKRVVFTSKCHEEMGHNLRLRRVFGFNLHLFLCAL